MRPVLTSTVFGRRTPQPAQPSRSERRKAETRKRIGRAALKLISRRGLMGTSVADITEAAKVGKGTFFNYFPSKEHVFFILVEGQHEKLRRALAQAERGRRSLRLLLHDLFLSLAAELGGSQALASALVASVLSSGTVRDIAATGMVEGRRLLARILSLGQERGEVRADGKASDMALALQEGLFGSLVVWAIHPEGELQGRLTTSFESYWRGIAARKG